MTRWWCHHSTNFPHPGFLGFKILLRSLGFPTSQQGGGITSKSLRRAAQLFDRSLGHPKLEVSRKFLEKSCGNTQVRHELHYWSYWITHNYERDLICSIGTWTKILKSGIWYGLVRIAFKKYMKSQMFSRTAVWNCLAKQNKCFTPNKQSTLCASQMHPNAKCHKWIYKPCIHHLGGGFNPFEQY